MSAPATENPIAPASVAIEVQPEASKEAKADKGAKPAKVYRQEAHRPDYKVICCGNSCLDLLLIPMTLVILYGAMIGLSLLVLWALFLTSASGAAHWVYFFAWLMGVFLLGFVVSVADHETYLKRQMAKKAQAEGTNA